MQLSDGPRIVEVKMSDAEFSYSKYLGTLLLLIFPFFGESLTRYENYFRGPILIFDIK